eukprot:gene4775-biopygen14581
MASQLPRRCQTCNPEELRSGLHTALLPVCIRRCFQSAYGAASSLHTALLPVCIRRCFQSAHGSSSVDIQSYTGHRRPTRPSSPCSTRRPSCTWHASAPLQRRPRAATASAGIEHVADYGEGP